MPCNVFYSHVQLHGVPVIRIQKVFRCMSWAVFYVQVRRHSVPLKEIGIIMRDLIVLRFIRRHGVLLKQIGILWFTCRCITTVFPQRDMCSAIFMSCAVYYFQLHRYGVPLLQCCVVHPGTSLWRFPETDMYFVVILCHVLYITFRYIAMVFLCISTVLYFQVHGCGVPVDSTVVYFQVHRCGIPVHQYCVVLPGTSLWCSCS